MKNKDIKPGMRALTLVSGQLVEVEVVGSHSVLRRTGFGREITRQRWRVKRVDNGSHLPKARSGASLRPLPRAVSASSGETRA